MTLKLTALVVVFFIAVLKDFLPDRFKTSFKWKISLRVALVVSFIIGVRVTVIDRKKSMPAALEQEKRYDSLQARFDELKGMSEGQDIRSSERSAMLREQMEKMSRQLEPFVGLALSKYPNKGIDEALSSLRKDLDQTKEMARPPILKVVAADVKKAGDGYRLTVQFGTSKNEPLGIIKFTAAIGPGRQAKILRIESGNQMKVSYEGSSSISPDGQSATLGWSLPVPQNPIIEIDVSNPATIILACNYLSEPLTLEIK